jgi:hypothetical protein
VGDRADVSANEIKHCLGVDMRMLVDGRQHR